MHPNAEAHLRRLLEKARRSAKHAAFDDPQRAIWGATARASTEALSAVGAISTDEADAWLDAMRETIGAPESHTYTVGASSSVGIGGIGRPGATNPPPPTTDLVAPPPPVFLWAAPGPSTAFHPSEDAQGWITTVEFYDLGVLLVVRLRRVGPAPTYPNFGAADDRSWFAGPNPDRSPLKGLAVTDDTGTSYDQRGSWGSGDEREVRFEVRLVPGPAPAATELRIDWAGTSATIPIARP